MFYGVNSCALFLFICAFCGCHTIKQPVAHLHNYPIIEGQDCPGVYNLSNYNPQEVKLRASALDMRPVDYLHWANNKRFTKQQNYYVGFTNIKKDK